MAVVAALMTSGLVGVQAQAAPKLSCKLVVDGAGDAQPVNSIQLHAALLAAAPAPLPIPAPPSVQQGPSSDTLDIVSADLVSDKKWVTAVIRVKKLTATSPSAAPTGITWYMSFTADGTDFVFAAHTDPTGAQYFDAAYITATGGSLYAGGPIGKIDLAKNEVRISVPTDVMASQATVKAGLKFTKIAAGAANELAIFDKSGAVVEGGIFEYAPVNTDAARTTKTYVAGTKNCVLPGK